MCMLRRNPHILVLSVSVGSLPTAPASSAFIPKPNARIRYRQKPAGISDLEESGTALERFAVSRRDYQAAEHQTNAGGRAVERYSAARASWR